MVANVIQLLLIEDNPGDAFIIQDMLKQISIPTITITHIERLDDAFEYLNQASVDGVLLDLSLPDSYGLDTLLSFEKQAPTLPVVILSGTDDEELAIQAVQQGAQDYLVKGQVSKDIIFHAVRYAIERKKIALELKQRTLELEIANQTLNRRTAQLELANQELESFSYTVSHDLANPLAAIIGFASLLELTYVGDPHEQEKRHKHCIEGIQKAANRMNQLIQDLLQLSKMSRGAVQSKSVDLSILAQEILYRIKQSQPSRIVETVIQPKLITQCDPNLLNIALENLLGNAWKYTRKQEDARIEFGSISSSAALLDNMESTGLSSHYPVFFIRDNGAGFDMQKAHKLFTPFQRLHTSKDFDGTGIGLATVHRIIQRHGGQIWADAVVDQGATFYFTLPTVACSESQGQTGGLGTDKLR